MSDRDMSIKTFASTAEREIRNSIYDTFKRCPIPKEELLSNLGLFVSSKNLARILFMDAIYSQIIDVHGVVMEFGTRWGQNTALFSALRGIYEPFNRHRKLVCFDTFEGFPGIATQDGNSDMMKKGGYAVSEGYEAYLDEILNYQEQENPISHIRKFEIRKGDASIELGKYIEENPETIIALAYFDMDLYEPTKKCLEAIRDRVTKGTVLVFDELCDHDCPGETTALMETFGLRNLRLKRSPITARVSYFVVE